MGQDAGPLLRLLQASVALTKSAQSKTKGAWKMLSLRIYTVNTSDFATTNAIGQAHRQRPRSSRATVGATVPNLESRFAEVFGRLGKAQSLQSLPAAGCEWHGYRSWVSQPARVSICMV